jgi:hypothetical protein
VIVYSKKLIRIVEAWNGEQPSLEGVDLVRCFQRASPSGNKGCREFHTILLDLTKEPDQLMAKIKKETRYEIRRAAVKDQLTYRWMNAKDQTAFESFCDYYDEFALQKGLAGIQRRWLSLMAQTSALHLSRIEDNRGATLVWHSYYCSGGRATLLYSISLYRSSKSSEFRNSVGRANRFHHWRDILRFKAEGASIYDFGGWYEGDRDRAKLNINRFKEEFGGEIVKNFICEHGVTIKGRLFIHLRRLAYLGRSI